MDQERENYAETGRRMNWRLVRWFVAVLLIIALAAILIEWATLPHQLTQEEADRIQLGMTPEEVEAVFGRPPDSAFPDVAEWKGRGSFIDVCYRDGRVERVVCRTGGGPGFFRRWKQHLGLGY
jgi:hypothetical protein